VAHTTVHHFNVDIMLSHRPPLHLHWLEIAAIIITCHADAGDLIW
jgi:hypothetical protein